MANRPNRAALVGRLPREQRSEGDKQRDAYVRAMSRSKHALNSTTKALAEEVSKMTVERKAS